MDTFVIERQNSLIFTNRARVVRAKEDVSVDLAARTDFAIEEANPYIKYIVGDFVEADRPNDNTQFWTSQDLAISEPTIKHSPLNMLHKQRVPIGFFLSTHMVTPTADSAARRADPGFPTRNYANNTAPTDTAKSTAKIEAMAGMWSHVFPFESALIDQADEMDALFFSMECRGSHVHCAGPNGCDKSFKYMEPETHCAHLKERSSIRHIVNPIFRGGAVILPPTQPGWKDAHASVVQQAVREEAALYAEQTETAYNQANVNGTLTAAHWEHLMGTIMSLGRR